MKTNWLFFEDVKHSIIKDPEEHEQGRLDDVILDLETGEVVLFLLGGDGRLALPPSALQFQEGEGRVNYAEDRIKAAPGSGSKWPEKIDRDFILDVHRYWGYKPHSNV